MKLKYFLCLLSVLLLIGCAENSSDITSKAGAAATGANGSDAQALRVPTWPLVKKNWAPHYFAFGEIAPLEELEIEAPAAGVTAVHVKTGDAVGFATMLYSLETADAQKLLVEQQAKYEQAFRDYAALNRQIVTLEGQDAPGQSESIVAGSALLELRSQRDELVSVLREFDAQRQNTLRELFEAEVLSPIAGEIRSVQIDRHDSHGSNKQSISITPLRAVAAQVAFSPEQNGDLADDPYSVLWPGMRCTLKSPVFGGLQFPATLQRIDTAPGQNSRPGKEATAGGDRRIDALLVLDNPDGGLQPGMPVRARCEGQWRENVLVMPRKALVQDSPQQQVYVIEQGRARLRMPLLGLGDAENLPVLDGLEEGDELIIGKTGMLAEGTAVKVLKWVKVSVKDDY
ncbi:MAG: hypothetical protein WBN40_13880 [Pseudomonadales bacterium]